MIHRLISDQLTVEINSFGAELCNIKNKAGIEFLWQAKQEVWPRHAPVLFPIVGKLKDNSYILNDKAYRLAQHGFARDNDFTLIEGTDQTCTFQLRDSENTKKTYPFEFNLQIIYSLSGNTLTCSYKIANPSQSDLLFSIGAHPGFNCPLTGAEAFEDYYLELEKSSLVQTTLSDGLRSGKKEFDAPNKKIELSPGLFDNDALVFENNQVNKIALRSSKSSYQVVMTCEGWPSFGIWTKKGSSEFVCLEPWYGIADGVNSEQKLSEKTGIIRLGAEGEFNCSFSIQAD